MNDEMRDLLELALRLEHHRSLPPRPLFRRGNPARDGPAMTRSPLRRKESRHGLPGAPQYEKRPIDYRSKGIG
jgi:hypothetical protein